jgi:hypothetical protein
MQPAGACEVLQFVFVEMDPILEGFLGVFVELVRVREGYVLRETATGTGNQLLYFCTGSEDLAYAAFLRELSGSGRQAFGNAA